MDRLQLIRITGMVPLPQDGTDATPTGPDCRVGKYRIKLLDRRSRSRQAWHLSPIHRTLPGLPLQRWFYHDWRWKRETGVQSHVHQSCRRSRLKIVSQFKKLVENVLRMPELLTDPRFANNHARVENRDALVKIITDILVQNTRDHWLAEFEGLG